MTNFLLGMATMYLLTNLTVLFVLFVVQWEGRKEWRIQQIILILLFGLPAAIYQSLNELF